MSEQKNRKKLKVELEGREVEIHVLKPNNKMVQEGVTVYNRAFLKAVKPPDGGPGAITRPALESVMRQQNIWDDARQSEYEKLDAAIKAGAQKLKKGGFKVSEGRALAVQMRRDRWKMRQLVAERNSLDANTAEAQAENARFNHFVASCTVHPDGRKYWASLEDYLDDDSAVAGEAAAAMGELWWGLDDNFEKNLPENAWLLKYRQVDDKLHLVDREGRRVNVDGKLVDENGKVIGEEEEVTEEPVYDDDGSVFLPVTEERAKDEPFATAS